MAEPSHVRGAAEPALWEMTIGEALDAAARRWPEREALVDCGQAVRLSWRDLARRAGDFAAGLLALGLAPGDRIGIWSLNRVEWAITQFAAAKAGLVLVTINPNYRLSELEYALRSVGCAAVVTASVFKSSDYVGMLRTLMPEMAAGPGFVAERLPALRHVIQMDPEPVAGAVVFATVEALGRDAGPARLRALEGLLGSRDPVNIQFTSGTTGLPKGVTLSHRNILNNGYFTGLKLKLTAQDRICIPVPLYHCFGMVMGNLAAVTHGAAMVYPGEGFDPLATLAALSRERCTALYGVPTMFIAQLEHPAFAAHDLSSLRTGIMAGSPCPIEVMRKAIDRMNLREITICYGMTETSPVSFQSETDDPVELRVGTVGRVHPHLEVKIVDDAGETVPRGVAGELCTRGYSVMLGYWNDPEQTAGAIDDAGWMHSGDLATIDEDGYCRIVGRIKDMVIRGGENLYPREIEEFLHTHPAIRDVAVFGVPDPHYGEELCAWIIRHDGAPIDETEVRAFCRGHISHQKIPRHIRFVDAFPLTVTGKVQKFVMREQMVRDWEDASTPGREPDHITPARDPAGRAPAPPCPTNAARRPIRRSGSSR
ncbi:AMP-binding protein [Rhizorhabdus wittichii DC-6]|nr:AMP-binding protein [Rhizorhabdus wittichii DC-6]